MLRNFFVLIITLFLTTSVSYADETGESHTHKTAKEVLEISKDDRVLGNKDAKIQITEYASLSCSHCASFHMSVLPKIKEKYIDTGKVKLKNE